MTASDASEKATQWSPISIPMEKGKGQMCHTLLLALRKKTPNYDYKRETLPGQTATRT